MKISKKHFTTKLSTSYIKNKITTLSTEIKDVNTPLALDNKFECFYTFIYNICKNLCKNYKRKKPLQKQSKNQNKPWFDVDRRKSRSIFYEQLNLLRTNETTENKKNSHSKKEIA